MNKMREPLFRATFIRGNFYSKRVINKWNSLPSEVKMAPNINIFKSRYDKQ